MTNTPKISVIMPVYNSEKYLKEAIESVLAQTYKHVEIIAIDDKSTDGSLSLLKTFGDKISVIENPVNVGAAIARNIGLAKATGDFIAFMDADDLWHPEKLDIQAQEFEKNGSLDMVFSHVECFFSPDLSEEVRRSKKCPEVMPGFLPAASLIRSSSFKKVGDLDGRFRVGEFIDWLSRARSAGLRSLMLDQILLFRRIHETNTGTVKKDFRVDCVRIVRESMRRNKPKSI
jgi:glycosyltransferase involved in cell wall biosynthesis